MTAHNHLRSPSLFLFLTSLLSHACLLALLHTPKSSASSLILDSSLHILPFPLFIYAPSFLSLHSLVYP
ncbi:hypothetical protein EDB85DRAFT_1957203, partial [Lactarius pseudohatsudake]